jgi:hypothetical protein
MFLSPHHRVVILSLEAAMNFSFQASQPSIPRYYLTREQKRKIEKYFAVKWGLWDAYHQIVVDEAMDAIWPAKARERTGSEVCGDV